MRRLLIVALLALLLPLGGYWGWAEFIRDPSEAIKAELKLIASLAQFNPSTEGYEHTRNIDRLCQYFASDVIVNVNDLEQDLRDIHGRLELEMQLRSTTKVAKGLSVEFLDIVPSVSLGNRSALVNLTLKAHFLDDEEIIAQELKMNMKKSGGKWLITRVDTVKTLRP